jgi:branched-chain amino acid transport system ATP-binding protein
MALRCENLTKVFGGTVALDHVDLAFPSHSVTAIVGPNGAGKTTLIDVLTGFRSQDAGRWMINDVEITGLSPHRIANLGVVRTFQQPRLIFDQSVLENVLLGFRRSTGEGLLTAVFGSSAARNGRDEIRTANGFLELVGLADYASRLAAELSFGQQKLATIACSLASEPSALLLDEPFGGVSRDAGTMILDLLRHLRDAGSTIVFVEHDLDAVRRIADVAVVMANGRVLTSGAPKDALESPDVLEAYLA